MELNIHVHKFGGSCLSAIEDIDAVVERVRHSKGRAVVIVSAFNGITDRLIEQIDYRASSSNSTFVASIAESFERVAGAANVKRSAPEQQHAP